MNNQLKEKKYHKFITWVSIPIIMIICAIGTTVLWYLANFTGEAKIFVRIISTVMFLLLPWGLTFWSIKLGWTVVKIDENGIKRELFGFLFKRQITWEELHEIRFIFVLSGGGWIFFSKKSLENMSLGKARNQKGQIQIVHTERLIEVIRLFTDKEIVNLTIETTKE